MAGTPRERTTLKGVVAKVKTIGARDYDDKIFDNILPIFNKLQNEEKRVLLKGLINIVMIVDDKVIVDANALRNLEETVESIQETAHQDSANIEHINRVEMIKLKSWVFKALFLSVMGVATLVITLVVFLTGGQLSKIVNMKAIEDWIKVAKTMIGIMS